MTTASLATQENVQRRLSLVVLIVRFAEACQSDVSDKAYELYSATLCKYPEVGVQAVISGIAERCRAEGEKVFPRTRRSR